MDHTAARKRPSSARFQKYLPYPTHQAGYQIFRGIYCSSIMVICIDTPRLKWNFWTSHPSTRPADMSSKSSRSSNKRHDNLGLRTPQSKSQERVAPTHRIKDRTKMDSIRTTSPSRKQRRTLGRQRKILRSGATSHQKNVSQ